MRIQISTLNLHAQQMNARFMNEPTAKLTVGSRLEFYEAAKNGVDVCDAALADRLGEFTFIVWVGQSSHLNGLVWRTDVWVAGEIAIYRAPSRTIV